MRAKLRQVLVILAAILYVFAGSMHFLKTDSYLRIMPPWVPSHLAMVYLSGAAEIAGGIGLLVRSVRRWAAWGLVALLIAVFPANVYMATNQVQLTATPVPAALLWARLPVQALLIWWLLWSTERK